MSTLNEMIKTTEGALVLKGADDSEIRAAEITLELQFSEEFKTYTAEFGAAYINGIELTGVVPDPNLSVTALTISARSITPQAMPSWYVVRDLHIDGVIIWQDEEGRIFQTQPFTESAKLCNSLCDYINLEG